MKTPRPFAPIQMALRFLLAALLLAVTGSVAWAAMPPDDYIGDAAIYAGVPSERPKPNILIIVDTSQATLGRAPGKRYSPTDPAYDTGPYVGNQVYYSDQAGTFAPSRNLGGGSPVTVGGVSCVVYDGNGAPVLDAGETLALYGTYSGSGSDSAPNLSSTGTCEPAPKGAVYATGHYLNYTNTASTLETSCDSRTIVIKYGKWTGAGAPPKKYKLINNIYPFSTAAMEPGVGADWEKYWSLLPKTDPTPITYELDALGRLVPWTNTGRDGWRTGLLSWHSSNTFTCTVNGELKTQRVAVGYYSWDLYYALASTQRQAFFNALEPVISGASNAVNFGFLIYNRLNQGAVIGADILSDAESRDPAKVQALISKIPNMSTCTRNATINNPWNCPDTISSGPNRPQSEALYDAGYYFGATYKKTDGTAPNKQSINLNRRVPNPNRCGYNHIIYLTNGLPNQDTNTPDLGDWDGDNYGNEMVYGLGTHLMDDVAAYLHNEVDLRPVEEQIGSGGGITTHVVLAFQAEDALLRNTAAAGGGEFYNVFNTEGLSKALLNILANIVREADSSFVAPVVPASSTNRTRSGERVYLGLFKPQTNATWHGNLKKYRLSTTNDLLDSIGLLGNPATNNVGDFIYSQSYWGTAVVNGTTVIMGADGNRNLVPATYVPQLNAEGNPTNVDPAGGDGGIVDAGGAGGVLLARDLRTRRILTPVDRTRQSPLTELRMQPVAGGPVTYNLTPTQLGLDATETVKRSRLIDFLYGFDTNAAVYTEGMSLPKRKWVLGDILHSKPLVRSYWQFKLEHEPVCYNGSYSEDGFAEFNSTMIYVGANDGMLHAFNDCDGSEEWAFVPPILLDKLPNLPDGTHEFYMDASPVSYVYDANDNGNIESGDKIILVFGMRRGGGISYLRPDVARGAYYMLDITDPRNPQYLGEITSSTPNFSELGETWSQPVIDWIQDGTTAKLAMFVGAGYDNNEDRRWGNTQGFPVSTWSNDNIFTNDTDTTVPSNDGEDNGGAGVTSASNGSQLNPKGRGIYIVELARIVSNGATYVLDPNVGAGTLIKAFTADNTAGMNYSFPSDLTVLDWEGSDFVDRIYAVDTGGQLWRFDVKDTDPNIPGNDKNSWSARVIFNANPGVDGSTGRKFFYRPDVGKDGTDALIYLGSGDREHPLNKAVDDRLYMIRDKTETNLAANPPVPLIVATEANLKDLTSNELQMSSNTSVVESILTELRSPSNYGWFIKLEGNGEKMLAEPVLFFGEVLYTTYKPLPPVVDTCKVGNLGVAQLYHVDYLKATAVVNYDTLNDADYDNLAQDSLARGKEGEVLRKSDRVVTLGEGIPSGIVVLIDKSGKVSLKVAASGRLTDIKGSRINTYYPLYWTETILKKD